MICRYNYVCKRLISRLMPALARRRQRSRNTGSERAVTFARPHCILRRHVDEMSAEIVRLTNTVETRDAYLLEKLAEPFGPDRSGQCQEQRLGHSHRGWYNRRPLERAHSRRTVDPGTKSGKEVRSVPQGQTLLVHRRLQS